MICFTPPLVPRCSGKSADRSQGFAILSSRGLSLVHFRTVLPICQYFSIFFTLASLHKKSGGKKKGLVSQTYQALADVIVWRVQVGGDSDVVTTIR